MLNTVKKQETGNDKICCWASAMKQEVIAIVNKN